MRPDVFAKAVSTASCVVKKGNMPILDTILIVADSGTLTATGTDMDNTMRFSVPCDHGFRFSGCVDASQLSRIASGIRGDNVALRENKGSLVVACNKALFRLESQPRDDFPQIDSCIDGPSCQVGRDFFDAIKRVSPAAARDDIRYYINGIHIIGDGDTTVIEATNGHVCSRTTMQCGFVGDVILPNRFLKLMDKISETDQVQVNINKGYMKLSGGSVTVVSKLVDGKFPETTRIFDRTGYSGVRVNRTELSTAVRLASIQNDDDEGVMISVSPGTICVIGKGSTVDVSTPHSQDEKNFTVNPRYIRNALESSMNGEDVVLHIKDSARAIVISDDSVNLSAIMPMRMRCE